MNKLVCILVLVAVASAQQHWGGSPQQNHDYAPRRNFPPAPLAHDGRVVDTPEIANLKQAHFAAHDAAIKNLPHKPQFANYEAPRNYDDGSYNEGRYNDEGRYSGRYTDNSNSRYNDDNNGRYNEVQYQENNDRFNDYNENQAEKRWRGPLAKIEFTSDGKFIKETPEVAHARQQHLAALAAAAKKGGDGVGYEGERYEGGFSGQYRGEGEESGQYNPGNWQREGQQGSRGYEDNGQYRAEPRFEGRPNFQGQGNQQGFHPGRPQGGFY